MKPYSKQMLKPAVFLLCAMNAATSWGEAGLGGLLTDRPSARPLPAPGYSPPSPPDAISLPQTPQSQPAETGVAKVFIKRIVLQGQALFPQETLHELTQAYEGRPVSTAETEELREKLTQYYISKGYINSGALIPRGAYQDGVLTIQIVEGRLDEVRIKGQERLRERYIQQRLQGASEAPLNINELQDRFQMMLADPLISKMHGRLLPGAALGHSIFDVEITRARPYGLSLFGNNFRPPSIGAEAFGLNGWLRNLTGLGDFLDFTYTTSAGSERYSGGFSVPITAAGTLAFFRFDEGSSTIVEAPFTRLNLTSETHSLEGGLSHPLIYQPNQQLTVGALLAVREYQTAIGGTPISLEPGPNARKQATVWRLFQDYMQRMDRHVFTARSTFSVGMNALGATPETNRKLPDSEFFAWLGQGQYAYLLHENGAQFVLRGNVQLSSDPLLALERIAIGGFGTVRGYRENQLVRDQGYSVSMELHYPVYGDSGANARHRLSLVPFMDYGEAWNRGGQSVALHSVGIGLNWLFRPVTVDFYYGYAINKPQPKTRGDIQDDGLHFQVRLNAFEMF
jgi:hemolysin activation/secretion protein